MCVFACPSNSNNLSSVSRWFLRVTVHASSIFVWRRPKSPRSAHPTTRAISFRFPCNKPQPSSPSLCQMINRCQRLPLLRKTTAHLPRRIMSSVPAPPAPHQPATESFSTTKAAAFSPDAPQPAFAGTASAPAGAADSLADDESAPLRFKGTQPVCRGRTAVPGERADCAPCSDHTNTHTRQLLSARGCIAPTCCRPSASYAAACAHTHTGLATTCWGTDQLKQQYPQLNEDTDADVAVVGGGISGLTTAYLLAKAGEV